MKPLEILRSVFLNLQANKFRVFLTSLGIIIGAFTIIMVVGIGKGSEQVVADQYKRLSVETIMVRKSRNFNSSRQLTLKQAAAMKTLPDVADVAALINMQSGVSYGATTETTLITGITESYQQMVHMELESGAFLTDLDGTKRNKAVLLGNAIAQALFGEDVSTAVGNPLMIKGRIYQVKGILKRVGDSTGNFTSAESNGTSNRSNTSRSTGDNFGGGGSIDDGVFIPYEIAVKYTAGKRTSPIFSIQAKNIQVVTKAIEEITDYITGMTGDSNAYMVMDAGSRLSAAQGTAKAMSSLLIAVAVIVLIVGGIGIMNVLFVSVKERTREIGILKSIGARRQDILWEFLLESVFISVVGGGVGSILGLLAVPVLKSLSLNVLPSSEGVMLALVFSIVTGTFFGYYPALKAAKLKPIHALNYE